MKVAALLFPLKVPDFSKILQVYSFEDDPYVV